MGSRRREHDIVSALQDLRDKHPGLLALSLDVTEQPPLRVLFGAPVPEIVREIYDRRLKEWAKREDPAIRAYGR